MVMFLPLRGCSFLESIKQACSIRSTMEVEFIFLKNTSFKIEWLKNLLVDIPL